MTNTGLHGNRHIVDRLADVRGRIKEFETEETELKARVSAEMGGRDSLGGDEFIAIQSLTNRKGGLDEAKIAAALKVDNLDAYRKPGTVVHSLKVERRMTEVA